MSVIFDAILNKMRSASSSGVTSFKTRTGAVVPASGDYSANLITFTPVGGVSSVTVQTAIAELDSEKINATEKGSANGLATLGADGKVPSSQIPSIALTEYLGNFADTTAALADSGVQASQRGDWFTLDTDGGQTYIVITDSPTLLAHIKKLSSPTDTVLSVNGQTGAVTLTKTDVGLGNVENTALSTWAGSSNITTLGTITTGTWSGSSIGVTKGGTGLSTVADASILVTNAQDTFTVLTAGAGQSIRRNAGNTAWEAYTPSSGVSWWTSINWSSGAIGLSLTLDNSYSTAGPIGYSLTVSNTQTNTATAYKATLWSSNLWHTGFQVVGTGNGNVWMSISVSGSSTTGVYIWTTWSAFSNGVEVTTANRNIAWQGNNGIKVTNQEQAYQVWTSGGGWVFVYQTGVGGTAIGVYAWNNINTGTNGLVNVTLSNTQSGATVAQKIDLWTSAQWHTGLLVTSSNNNASVKVAEFKFWANSGGTVLNLDAGDFGSNAKTINATANTNGKILYASNSFSDNNLDVSFISNPRSSTSTQLLVATQSKTGATWGRTADYISVTYTENWNTTSTFTNNYNLVNFKRVNNQVAAGTQTSQGTVMRLENVVTPTSGSLTDTVTVLSIIQDTDSTGGHILLTGNSVPGSNPASGSVILYLEGGALKARSANGTITTIAPL